MRKFYLLFLVCSAAFSAANACPSYLHATTSFPAHNGTRGVAVADFNGDGNLDVVVANQNSNDVSILLGDGAGGLSAPTNIPTGAGPVEVAVGDFNGDGRIDIAVTNSVGNSVSILINNGGGSFAPAVNYAVGANPNALVVADFNGDGHPDIATANSGTWTIWTQAPSSPSNNVSVLLNLGNGVFAAPANHALGVGPDTIGAGDFNGDGKPDLAVGYAGESFISVLINDGAGGFLPPSDFPTPNLNFMGFLAIGDFNGDGKLDIGVIAWSGIVGVLYGDGAGSFSLGFGPVNSGPPAGFGAAAADVNGDGIADLIVVGSSVSFVINNSIVNDYNFSIGLFSIALGDFNGDGILDLVGADASSGVTLNLGTGTCSSISTVVPNTGSTNGGQTVTLNGSLLAGATKVTFGGVAATITGNTPTSVTVTTPAHAAGTVDVVLNSAGGTTTVTNGFTFVAGAPSITSLSAKFGLTTGGDTVTIVGTNLTSVTRVTFGGSAATITASTPSSLTVVTPPHAPGAVDVVATSPGGTSTLRKVFIFVPHLPPSH